MSSLRSKKGRNEYVVRIRDKFRLSRSERRTGRRPRFFEPGSKQWWRGGKMPRRDSFRQRCYRAEDSVRMRVGGRQFADLAEAARYVRSLMETKWFQRRFPYFRECKVWNLPGSRKCWAGPSDWLLSEQEAISGRIQLSTWGIGSKTDPAHPGGELILLHELAHAVLPPGHLHDRRWARTFVEFVGFKLGREARSLLVEAFREQGVKLSPPRKGTPGVPPPGLRSLKRATKIP